LDRSPTTILAILVLLTLLAIPTVLAAPEWAKEGNYAVYEVYVSGGGNEAKLKMKCVITDVTESSFKVSCNLVESSGSVPGFNPRSSSRSYPYTYASQSCDLYHDPSKLPENGVIELTTPISTITCRYDKSTGWLLSAEGRASMYGQEFVMKVELVESNFVAKAGGGFLNTWMIVAIAAVSIAVVAAIVAVVLARRARASQAPTAIPQAPSQPPSTPPPS